MFHLAQVPVHWSHDNAIHDRVLNQKAFVANEARGLHQVEARLHMRPSGLDVHAARLAHQHATGAGFGLQHLPNHNPLSRYFVAAHDFQGSGFEGDALPIDERCAVACSHHQCRLTSGLRERAEELLAQSVVDQESHRQALLSFSTLPTQGRPTMVDNEARRCHRPTSIDAECGQTRLYMMNTSSRTTRRRRNYSHHHMHLASTSHSIDEMRTIATCRYHQLNKSVSVCLPITHVIVE